MRPLLLLEISELPWAVIARYDEGWRERLNLLARDTASRGATAYDRDTLKVRPPVPSPETMLNAAVNYVEHGNEIQRAAPTATPAAASPPPSVPGLWPVCCWAQVRQSLVSCACCCGVWPCDG